MRWLEQAGVQLIRGWARLQGERLVDVARSDGEHMTLEPSTAVILATGSMPDNPEIDGLDDLDTWDSRDATSSDQVPGRLIVIGGGAVGVEMAQAWSWLGSRVTLVHRSAELLDSEESFAGRELRHSLEAQGIDVITGGDTRRLEQVAGGIDVTVAVAADIIRLEADEALVAIGRRARTEDLGLDTVGLSPGDFVRVDHHMRAVDVPGDWLYAVGDVNGRHLLTHAGKYQARIAGAHAAGDERAAVSDIPATPRVLFTDPEIAAVGLTEARAREAGIAATIAIVGEVPLTRLWHAVPAFPTLSEVWLRLLEGYRDSGWDPYDSGPGPVTVVG